ncbi:RHS repeat-associated core domain-containing protein [Pseudomonas putida]|uniref:RHS repeat-associated core domain-containing protein n=1 Tax=Pseudomonas putida TaxID=303 RepID=UPI001E45777D|nr:RHS repeat-associated core domain-containing protein [Pseudomonas putida]MCC9006134.1 RHS repeat-associated core domain-containing protein [Pseudomonas putida]
MAEITMHNITQLFYQKNRIDSVKVGQDARKILRSPESSLAEITSNDHKATLTLTDGKNSTIRSEAAGKPEIFSYTPYGRASNLPSQSSALGFNGERYDTLTESYLLGLGYRTYNPRLMRFLSPDNVSPFGAGGVNSYAYVGNEPINNTDPTGHLAIFGIRLTRKIKLFSGEAKIVDDMPTYLSQHPTKKKSKAITIVSHGSQSEAIDTHKLNNHLIKSGFNTEKYDTHFIVCYSADPNNSGPSIIQKMANETGRNSHGYVGKVSARRPRMDLRKIGRDGTPISVPIVEEESIWNSQKDHNYVPKTAMPIRRS